MSVRKAHNSGRNHLRNVVDYYQRRSPGINSVRTYKHLTGNAAEIGHEKAQSVIDSITSSYAAEGQANPMLQPPGMSGGMGRGGFGPPPPFGFPGQLVKKNMVELLLMAFLGGPGQMPPPFAMGAREFFTPVPDSTKLTTSI